MNFSTREFKRFSRAESWFMQIVNWIIFLGNNIKLLTQRESWIVEMSGTRVLPTPSWREKTHILPLLHSTWHTYTLLCSLFCCNFLRAFMLPQFSHFQHSFHHPSSHFTCTVFSSCHELQHLVESRWEWKSWAQNFRKFRRRFCDKN